MKTLHNPLVSIIIPAYNVEKYIEEAISSILSQTYQNYEIIVIDDGSNDNTYNILRDNSRIRLFQTANQGAAKARNLGISMANGEFIAFLDADDIWLPKKLEKQIDVFHKNDQLGLVLTESIGFDENGFRKPFFSKTNLLKGDVVKNIFLMSNVATPSVMVRSGLLAEIGVFEEDLIVAEDDNLWMRIAGQYQIELVNEVLVHCRFRPGSLTSSSNNFFEGVMGHIELLRSKYPKIYNRLGKRAINIKKSYCYFNLGYSLFSDNIQNKKSREYFVKSFLLAPSVRCLNYYFLSFLSDSWKHKLKIVKNKLGIILTS